jgi:ribosomal-protein-alanine N-acetyltransferase
LKIHIRRMMPEDVEQVWQIERSLFSMPWSKTSFLYEASNSRNSFPIVAMDNEGLAGYAVAWFVSDELHIGNIAVIKEKQGEGAGRQLLEYLLREASDREVAVATLEVRVSNARAINLYRRYGFKEVAIRRRYYVDNGEDALVMLAEIGKGRTEAEGGTGERND